MNSLKKILTQESITIEELINCFEQVKNNGDVGVIKFDGEREDKRITVFISFPVDKNREMIRIDTDDLKTALLRALEMYI